MTAIVVGRTPKGNFIVTDAMKTDQSAKVKSYKDCGLVDKISFLYGSGSYCSLVGDATLESGITAFDSWCDVRDIKVDFARKEDMQKALTTTEVYVKLMQKRGMGIPKTPQSYVYFVDRIHVLEYIIRNINGKYKIQNFEIFKQGLVILNYAGMLIKINGVDLPSDQLFGWATRYLTSKHKEIKDTQPKDALENDFNGRFCGVVFSKNKNIKEKLYSPFKSLAEEIATEIFEPKDFWKLVNNNELVWNPVDGMK